MFSVNFIFLVNITHVFAIITCLWFLMMHNLASHNHVTFILLSPRFSKKKRGLCNTVRRPSVRPSVRLPFDRPLSPPRLLKLES